MKRGACERQDDRLDRDVFVEARKGEDNSWYQTISRPRRHGITGGTKVESAI